MLYAVSVLYIYLSSPVEMQMIDQAEHVIEDNSLFTFCKYEPIYVDGHEGSSESIDSHGWTQSCHLIYYLQQLGFQLGAKLVVY